MRTGQGQVALLVLFCGFALSGGAQQVVREVPSDDAGMRITIEAVSGPGGDPGELVQQATRSWESQLGAVVPGAQPIEKSGTAGRVAAIVERFQSDPGNLHGFLATGKGQAVCHVRVAAKTPGIATVLPGALRRCATELAQSADTNPTPSAAEPEPSGARVPATENNAAPQGGAPPSHPENWNGVAGVYFQSAFGFGAGGIGTVNYEPVVLFRDGTYYEIGGAALEDVDLAAAKAKRPAAFGQWSRSGDVFRLVSNKGKQSEMKLQDGQFFRSYSAEEGGNLAGKYERVSGGGNSAMGGSVSVLTKRDMTFSKDGRFRTNSSTAAMDTGGSTGVGGDGGVEEGHARAGYISPEAQHDHAALPGWP